jgi:2-oxoglutarate ferredoxin oxidoreductase subunit delta
LGWLAAAERGFGRMPTTIIKEFCKGCGFCIAYCPKKVYDLSEEMNKKGYRLPRPVRVEDCIECGLCDLYCPDFAILLEKTKKKDRPKGKEGR